MQGAPLALRAWELFDAWREEGCASLAQSLRLATVAAVALISAPATAQEHIVSSHLMPQESIGAEHLPNQGHLMPQPSDPTGVRALHAEAYLRYYRQTVAAARYDIEMAKTAGANTFNMLLYPNVINSQFGPIGGEGG